MRVVLYLTVINVFTWFVTGQEEHVTVFIAIKFAAIAHVREFVRRVIA